MKDRLIWLTVAGCAILTIVACWLIWTFMVAPMEHALKVGNEIKGRFEKVLNLTPRISVNNTIIFAENTPVFELVTVERTALIRHRFEETWLHSTKTFEIEATFTAHAGFDLHDPFTIDIRRGGQVADIYLPRAKILSLGMSNLSIVRDEDGLWNKLTAKDREKSIRALERAAKKEFASTGILAAATQEGEKRLSKIILQTGCQVNFRRAGSVGKDPGYP